MPSRWAAEAMGGRVSEAEGGLDESLVKSPESDDDDDDDRSAEVEGREWERSVEKRRQTWKKAGAQPSDADFYRGTDDVDTVSRARARCVSTRYV